MLKRNGFVSTTTYPGLDFVLLNLPERLATHAWFVRRSAVKLVSHLLLKSVVGHYWYGALIEFDLKLVLKSCTDPADMLKLQLGNQPHSSWLFLSPSYTGCRAHLSISWLVDWVDFDRNSLVNFQTYLGVPRQIMKGSMLHMRTWLLPRQTSDWPRFLGKIITRLTLPGWLDEQDNFLQKHKLSLEKFLQ